MSDLINEIAVSSRVRLARNYFDIPFSNTNRSENEQACVQRAQSAFMNQSEGCRYRLKLLSAMSKNERTALMEQHMISRDLLLNAPGGAALIRDDHAASVMINEEDHLRIQGMVKGLSLDKAAHLAFEAEEALQSVCAFSFDTQLGYLTACPTNTGTGMRASLMLHLPLLTRCKQMGSVTQSVAKLGLTIRGLYGEGSEALGDLFQVSNQVTLGRTEAEIIEAVAAVGNQLIDMETTLRSRALGEASYDVKDRIFRSYGILRYAMQMDASEWMQHWSNLRLGVSLRLLSLPLSTLDELLSTAQDAHAKLYRAQTNPLLTTDQARAAIIRDALNPTIQEV